VVDATVSTPALGERLFKQLPAGDHELVFIDINRMAETKHVLSREPLAPIRALFRAPALPFAVRILNNEKF
jgi:hypothetical protein